MTVKETLIKARDIIIERGVNRDGHYVNRMDGQCVCTIGSLQLATGATVEVDRSQYWLVWSGGADVKSYDAAWELLRQVFDEVVGTGPSLTYWNDEVATDEEIIALFDKAIARAE